MKHSLPCILITFLCFWASGTFAQVDDTRQATLSVRATATVTDNLQMLTIRNLDLISPAVIDNKIVVSPTSSGFAGMFKILGNPSARVRITFLQNETLKEVNDGLGEVSAQYFVSEAFEDTQFQSTLLQVGEANVRLSEQGVLFLWLGADLDLALATPGMYLSEFVIELEYI
ncbi:MAG: hypothetical protein ACK4SF_18850 [Algoriphagus aquaeductus]|uniref:DUF4402 domain-containing protein n=1 Tax=Algoriphagus aquaeductus TaxID=475299 RepID=A0A326RND7_9BACT|nr:hypothetical protein [Algoriphagus aquaeductus]PZV82162.1 hypothetical protein CLV31_10923 [Algoriphagus aquaeductus]